MKKLLAITFVTFILISCHTVKPQQEITQVVEESQILYPEYERPGEPGKCYAKAKLDGTLYWIEVICHSNFSKKLVKQIQQDLISLGHSIDESEVERIKFSTSTKKAWREFQKSNSLAYGALDPVSINKLHKQASKF